MRKATLQTLIAFFCALTMASAQEVPQVQKALISKVTASWCGNCGTWGWRIFDDLEADNSDNAIFLKLHYSGDLDNSTASTMATNFKVTGQPQFLVGNTTQNITSGNTSAKRTEIKATVDQIAQESPIANTGMTAANDGNEITVNAVTKFFQAAQGEYFLGMYVVEDGILNRQSGQSGDVEHNHILRDAMSVSEFGEMVANGSIPAEATFNTNHSITISPEWNIDNIEILAIVWQKVNNDYFYVNAHTVNEFTTTSVSRLNPTDASLKFMTNADKNHTVQLQLAKSYSSGVLFLTAMDGKSVQQLHQGALIEGEHTFSLNSNALPTGNYVLTFQTSEGLISQQVFLP